MRGEPPVHVAHEESSNKLTDFGLTLELNLSDDSTANNLFTL